MLKKQIFLLILLIFSVTFVRGEKIDRAVIKNSEIILYQNGLSLIKDKVSADLTLEKSKIANFSLENIPKGLIFDSIYFDFSGNFKVLDKSVYDIYFDIYNYVGQEVLVKKRDEISYKKAVVLGLFSEMLNYKIEDEVFFEKLNNLNIKMENLDVKKRILVSGEILKNKNFDFRMTYLLDSINSNVNYNMFIDGQKANLDGFLIVENNSNCDFLGASVKFFIGDLAKNNEDSHMVMYSKMAGNSYQDSETKAQSFDKYFIFSLPQKLDLLKNAKKILDLVSLKNFDIQEKIEIRNEKSYISQQYYENPDEKFYADNKIEFTNKNDFDLPSGKIKVYRKEKTDFAFFGETKIDNAAKLDKVDFITGKIYGICATRKQLIYKKTDDNIYEIEWEITIQNNTSKKQNINLIERIDGDWEILNADKNQKFEKLNSKNIKFFFDVEQNSKKIIIYKFKTKI